VHRSAIDLFSKVFGFVQGCAALDDAKGIDGSLCELLKSFGIDSFVFCVVPDDGRRLNLTKLIERWPDQAGSSGFDELCLVGNTVVGQAASAMTPVVWSDGAPEPVPFRRCALLTAAKEAGLDVVVCIPLHGPNGLAGVVCLAGRQVDLSAFSMSLLQMAAMHAFLRLQALSKPCAHEAPLLTVREREVLTWTARGKSAWETSCILGVSSHTVSKQLAAAARKLNASNKTQAVAEAMRRRWISL
jgi:LuxR family quorum sensing-dependent transcriptional regulator